MPPFSDYYEPRDWRKSQPITKRDQLTCGFRRKALDKLFQLAGYDRYDPSITKEYGWWMRYQWDDKQRKDYARWWIQQFVNQFRVSHKRAENEYAAFSYVYAWDDLPPAKVEVKKKRISRARPVPILYPL
jgi:alpha-amylase/alpha-mannosidase (GH57 family)